MRQSLQSSASSLGNDRHDRKKTSTLSHAHTTSSKSKSVPRSLRPEDVLELGTVIHKKTNIKSDIGRKHVITIILRMKPV